MFALKQIIFTLKNELHHILTSFSYQTCISYRNALRTRKKNNKI